MNMTTIIIIVAVVAVVALLASRRSGPRVTTIEHRRETEETKDRDDA
ncbi:MAG: hypothetical protein M3Q52_07670 [Pseudomonadota bacterium]|nr:hypothetical protein [Pseudomonadota bacterium]